MQNQIHLSEPYGRFAIILDIFFLRGLHLEFSMEMTWCFCWFQSVSLLEPTEVQQNIIF